MTTKESIHITEVKESISYKGSISQNKELMKHIGENENKISKNINLFRKFPME